jgi:superfamily II DNA helicase RecQ
MSATTTQDDIDVVCKHFGVDSYAMLCGSLARRNTSFKFLVKGDPVKSLLKSGEEHLSSQPNMQQLWYCNSRRSCEGSLLVLCVCTELDDPT